MKKSLPPLILLTQYFKYDPSTGKLFWIKQSGAIRVGDVAGRRDKEGRTTIRFKTELYHATRLIWLLQTGAEPLFEIDHIDGNASNDAWLNLRDIPHTHNMQNQKRKRTDSRQPYKGIERVSGCKNRWRAYIGLKGHRVKLGNFDTPEAAHAAYIKAKREYHEGNTL